MTADPVCAECAIPRHATDPQALWLTDRRGNSYCDECLVMLELAGELLAQALGWPPELEGERDS